MNMNKFATYMHMPLTPYQHSYLFHTKSEAGEQRLHVFATLHMLLITLRTRTPYLLPEHGNLSSTVQVQIILCYTSFDSQ